MPDEYKDIEIPIEEAVKPPEGYSEQDWAGLTPGEKAVAMDEAEHPEGEGPPVTKEELEGGEPEPEKKEEGEPPAPEPKPEEEPEEKPAEVAPAPTPEVMTDEALLAHKFVIEDTIREGETIPIPDDIQDKIDEIDEKFDTGDIDAKEHRDQIRELDRQATARYLQAKRVEQGNLLWEKEQALFFNQRPEYLGEKQPDGTFKSVEDTEIVYGALTGALKIAQKQGLSGMAALVKADQIVKKRFGAKETPAPKETVPPKKEMKPPAKMPEDHVNLGDLPPAGNNNTGGNFDQLDKLQGKKLEEFLAKNPKLVDRYLDDLNRGA